jgi:hypothetical protein
MSSAVRLLASYIASFPEKNVDNRDSQGVGSGSGATLSEGGVRWIYKVYMLLLPF